MNGPVFDKARETRLRRLADAKGLVLQKSRSRDPLARDHGTYKLVDPLYNVVVAHDSRYDYDLDLDAVEDVLKRTTDLDD